MEQDVLVLDLGGMATNMVDSLSGLDLQVEGQTVVAGSEDIGREALQGMAAYIVVELVDVHWLREVVVGVEMLVDILLVVVAAAS